MVVSRRPSNEVFKEEWFVLGWRAMCKKYGVCERSIFAWRDKYKTETGEELLSPNPKTWANPSIYSTKVSVPIATGTVIVGSDAHIWPGDLTTAQRAFIRFCKKLRPAAVVMNGDVIDAPSISRHAPIGWEKHPDVNEELEAAADFLHAVELAAGKVRKIWTLGNHDARFETWLATHAKQFRGVRGIHLKDHFVNWEPCWAVEVGGPQGAIVKHRFKGGIHATHNNTVWSGRSMVTGHLHSAKVTPFTDYNGTRYGVDCGCLAAPYTDQFGYSEENPVNWRSGFCVLTFVSGQMLMPELVIVVSERDGTVQFRGEIISV